MPSISPSQASFLFDLANVVLIFGATAVLAGTIGVVWMGSVKERYSDERIAANEAQTASANLRAAQADQGAAKANERAAEALERAADANARASEAQLRLEQIRTPRLLAQKDIAPFTHALEGSAGTKIDIMILGEGPEPIKLGQQIGEALFSPPVSWSGRIFRWTGVGAAEGVLISTRPDAGPAAEIASANLVKALQAAGIAAAPLAWPGSWTTYGGFTDGPIDPDAAIRAIVGTKPQ